MDQCHFMMRGHLAFSPGLVGLCFVFVSVEELEPLGPRACEAGKRGSNVTAELQP